MAQSEETQGSILWSGIALGEAAPRVFLANPAGTRGEIFHVRNADDHSRVGRNSVQQIETTGKEEKKANGCVSSRKRI